MRDVSCSLSTLVLSPKDIYDIIPQTSHAGGTGTFNRACVKLSCCLLLSLLLRLYIRVRYQDGSLSLPLLLSRGLYIQVTCSNRLFLPILTVVYQTVYPGS
jgi:hypothetical protein